MSLFGSLNTAISGLAAQSTALSNISDNVANSQNVGYKEVNTSFSDLLTLSDATQNLSGSVQATPQYANSVQGTVTQSTDPLAMAITGQGFFPVSVQAGTANGQPSFNPQPYYTRAGDFQLNASGYMVNSAGQYLNGWSIDPTTGTATQTSMAPVQISQAEFNPIATTQMALSANLPATGSGGAPISSQVQIYDALGTLHTVNLNWTQLANNDWSLAVNIPDNTGGAAVGSAEVKFGSTSGNPVPEGTVGSVTSTGGGITASPYTAGSPANLTFTVNFGSSPQTITLGMGNFGQSGGLTQYAGTAYTLQGLSQNGVPPGAFSSATTQSNGNVVVNYANGQSRTVAQIPIITFNAPDQLQRQDGQAFTATVGSGNPTAQAAGTNGAGAIVTGSVEQSNVDIASEFSKLIVAQEAYSANAKVVTSSQQLLQTTINMMQ